jgi:hypothetical protein
VALVTPVVTAVTIWFSQRAMVPAGLQLGDVLVLRAPVTEGEQPAADLAPARRGPGDAGAELQRVAEFSLGDPGDDGLLALGAGAGRLDDLLEIRRGQGFQVAVQEVPEAVPGVAGPAAAAVFLPDRAAPHIAGGLDGELDDVEQVHGDLRAAASASPRTGR